MAEEVATDAPSPTGVTVEAPSRLHLGFLDLNGSLGRRYGSLGLALSAFGTKVKATPADQLTVVGSESERALAVARRVCATWGLPQTGALEIQEAIPAHCGLGSGSQLVLAVGTALSRLHGLDLDPADLARACDRGQRSGAGLGAFREGGLLLDGGCYPDGDPPPVVARLPFPEDWHPVLVLDSGQGLHGPSERQAFDELPVFPAETAAHLCRITLMRLLPAVADRELGEFGAAIAEIQARVGDHFAPAQGDRFASPRVAEALEWLAAHGGVGTGQSSWGPTGYSWFPDRNRAEELARKADQRFAEAEGLRFLTAAPRNHGARIEMSASGPFAETTNEGRP